MPLKKAWDLRKRPYRDCYTLRKALKLQINLLSQAALPTTVQPANFEIVPVADLHSDWVTLCK